MKFGVAIAIFLLACISVISSAKTRFQSVGRNYNINYNSNMNTNLDLDLLLSTLFGQQISTGQQRKLPPGPTRFYDHFHASFSSDGEEEENLYDIDDSYRSLSTGIPKAITSTPPSVTSPVPPDILFSVPFADTPSTDQIDETDVLMPLSDDSSRLEILELEPVEAPMLNETEA